MLLDAEGAPRLTLAHCPALGEEPRPAAAPRAAPLTAAAVAEALRATGNNKRAAARRLGVSRRYIYRKLAERSITLPSSQTDSSAASAP